MKWPQEIDGVDIDGLRPEFGLMQEAERAVRAVGQVLLKRFTTGARLRRGTDVVAAITENDHVAVTELRPRLARVRPGAGWVDDGTTSGLLPTGEHWITDPVEGNVNHIHGLPDWGVTATLLRDNEPVITVAHLPAVGVSYTAAAGGGAFAAGRRLRVSSKEELSASLVATGQAAPGERARTLDLMATSVRAMLSAALLVQMSVPATLPLAEVSAGRLDAFWQHSAVRSGLVGGALLVREAGGIVTDLAGFPWTLASESILAAAPAIHGAALTVLASASGETATSSRRPDGSE